MATVQRSDPADRHRVQMDSGTLRNGFQLGKYDGKRLGHQLVFGEQDVHQLRHRHAVRPGSALGECGEKVVFLVSVVIWAGLPEIAQNGLRGAACRFVRPVFRQISQQPFQRAELLLNALMTGFQHLQRFIQRGCDRQQRIGTHRHSNHVSGIDE